MPSMTVADSRGFLGSLDDAGGPREALLPPVAAPKDSPDEPSGGLAEGVETSAARGDRDRKPENVTVSAAPRGPGDASLGAAPTGAPAAAGDAPRADPRDFEEALALAVERASRAQRWDVVGLLARELEARRMASAGNVVPIGAKRSPK